MLEGHSCSSMQEVLNPRLPIYPNFDGQSYLLPVGGCRCQVEIVEVHESWPRHQSHKKKCTVEDFIGQEVLRC